MSMNPITTTEKIKQDYISYLESIMMVRNPEINKKTREALRSYEFVKGPFLESTPPFELGLSLKDLIQEGIACKEFQKVGEPINLERSLYIHQEKAFRKVVSDKSNMIVSTGTGSGKTECYLYPIFDYLMKQKEQGTLDHGVRALLLFPMNALANDQIKRLRQLLIDYPDITFGRYTGETIEKEEDALIKYREKYQSDPLPNELISREEMRAAPPHLLLTNYAMLEYLLLRPNDSELFDGASAKSWKFIVIDEAHTYKGSNGTEIAFLLRRLKDRICNNERGRLQCIATSATLGDLNQLESLAVFAESIFDEPFDKDDIILSERIHRKKQESMRDLDGAEYVKSIEEANQIKNEMGKNRYAFDILKNDSRLIRLQDYLKDKPQKLSDAALSIFEDLETQNEKMKALTSMIELGAMAKPTADAASLLPARYHLFVKSLEGMFATLYPQLQIFLDRRESFTLMGKKYTVFELANCQQCGQEYLVGNLKDGYLCQPSEIEQPEYYMIGKNFEETDLDIDEDDEAFEEAVLGKPHEYILCTACGKLTLANQKKIEECCDVNDSKKRIKVYKLSSNREINTCAMCGSLSSGIIKRFMTSNQAATFVLADSIYKIIPPNEVKYEQEIVPEEDFLLDDSLLSKRIEVNHISTDENGRKLLIFSDNRQEAAYFAGYMDKKYKQNIWRRLIVQELKKCKDGLLMDDLISRLVQTAERSGIFENDEDVAHSEDKKYIVASQYLFNEFMGTERSRGLEGSGYVEFFPEPLGVKNDYGLDGIGHWNLIRFMMDTLRLSNATNYPDNVNAEDDFFEPRNRYVFFRKEKRGKAGSKQILAFMPAESRINKRISVVRKLLQKQDYSAEQLPAKEHEVLDSLYGKLITLMGRGYLDSTTLSNEGICYTINYKKWRARYIQNDTLMYKCNRCGKISAYSINGFCTELKCSGTLEEYPADELRSGSYLSAQYDGDKIIPMQIKEHTAQLKKDRAGQYQEDFEKGILNILSCSTTFEMGVDVGQLEAILLRNVPPETANYIQRAGRAGRRTSSTAFSVTFVRRNSHDLNYFKDPIQIISGKIKAPYIEINNEKIAFRHANSIVCSWFFKQHRSYFEQGAGTLCGFNGIENMALILRRELEERPDQVIHSFKNVFNQEVLTKIGYDDWTYVDQLVDSEEAETLNGKLSVAISERYTNLKSISELISSYMDKHDMRHINAVKQLLELQNTFDKEGTIPFLASAGILPKYGFPVDVVNLDIYSNSEIAKGIDISRDLKMAIAEFAPGSSIVAGGKVWRSHSINTVRDKEWPTYRYYECPSCKVILPPDPGKEITVLGSDVEDEEEKIIKECHCGTPMVERKFIIPIFGFSTCFEEKPKNVGDSKPKKDFATRVQFWGVDKLDAYQEKELKEELRKFGDKFIKATYSPNGKLVVLNRGAKGAGVFVCRSCGYAQAYPPKPGESHKTKNGVQCWNKRLVQTSIGHAFHSDILKLEMPSIGFEEESEWNGNKYASVLYSILDGASDELGIARGDINGCIDHTTVNPTLILFDEAAGGAGHVKRIFTHLEDVLSAAMKRVDGSCGCGLETSCYGCLRNYNNQFEHDDLVRGLAYKYLVKLLS